MWELFLNSSNQRLNDLLHNGNKCGAVPIGNYINLWETLDDMKIVIGLLKPIEYNCIRGADQ